MITTMAIHCPITVTSGPEIVQLRLCANPTHLSPREARDLARALLEAADAAGEDDG